MNKIYYIGRFTPTSGGVTAKNSAIFCELKKHIQVEMIDLTLLKKANLSVLFCLVKAFLGRNNTFIIGTAAEMRRLISKFLYFFNRKALNRSVLMVMGGRLGYVAHDDAKYRKYLKEYRAILIETGKMKEQFDELGFSNVYMYENCRPRPNIEISVKKRNEKLKCVCFSMIYPKKGIDTALLAAEELPDISFDFYGGVSPEYVERFNSDINRLDNCTYHGVFKVNGDNVYQMLNGYDVLLFPTRHRNEGVPGTLVEAKIAALPAIVTDFASRPQLITDGVDGIVMKESSVKGLVDAIITLRDDDELLTRLKHGAKESGKNYYFENHIDILLSFLK